MKRPEASAAERHRQTHGFPPVFDENSRILILGSFPSVKSRADSFYYAFPQNRFWRMLSAVLQEPLPETVEEKTALLLRNGIALWDVLESCEICGSSDASIRNPEPADIGRIMKVSPIRQIIVNGSTAKKYYDRYLKPVTGVEAVCLPSTSPANASWSLPRLIEVWGAALRTAQEGGESRTAQRDGEPGTAQRDGELWMAQEGGESRTAQRDGEPWMEQRGAEPWRQ